MSAGDGAGQPAGKIKDVDKQMAHMCHYSALAGMLACGIAAPLGPALVWLAKKDMGPFVDYHGKEALNFQLTLYLPTVLLMLLGFIDAGFLALPGLVLIYDAVMSIMAGNKAAEGAYYRYPATFRLFE